VWVVVISEGLGANWLKQQVLIYRLNNLVILAYQPFEDLAEIFSAADVLVEVLQPEVGAFPCLPKHCLIFVRSARCVWLCHRRTWQPGS
jgi:hypothetical protein